LECWIVNMRLGWLLVFIAIPFLEIALLIKVGQMIGFWPTVSLVVLSAMFGSFVIYDQGFQVMGRALDAMNRGKPPVAPVIDGMFILLAGTMLILPGFISDAVGLALLVPTVRHRFAIWSLRRLFRSGIFGIFTFGASAHQSAQGQSRNHPPAGDGPIIEGEFERLDERTVDHGRNRDRPPPGRP
jgi:UPF0716 protein FxsA